MMTEQQRYYTAYQQGIKDVEAGVEHRLEICQDDKEYNFYIQGRKTGKMPPPAQPIAKTPEELPPIVLNIEDGV